jgi:GT2 family glycosyltransferase
MVATSTYDLDAPALVRPDESVRPAVIDLTEPAPIAVVIPTHNRKELLRPLLERLLADSGTCEVVVAADGCTDGTDELLTEWSARDPRVRPLLIHPQGGSANARAAAVAAASTPVVLALDDDIEPGPGLVAGHARLQHRQEGLVVVGYMPTETPTEKGREQFATLEYAANYESTCEVYEQDPDRILLSLWTGNVSFPKDMLIQATSGYDSEFRYHGDADLGIRLHELGARAVFDRSLASVHHHERDWAGYLDEAHRAARGMQLLAELHPDYCEPFGRMQACQDAGRTVRAVLRVVDRPVADRLAIRLTTLLGKLAGRLGRYDLEGRFASLTRCVIIMRHIA